MICPGIHLIPNTIVFCLDIGHVFPHFFFGHLLHVQINRRVYFHAVLINIYFLTVWFELFFLIEEGFAPISTFSSEARCWSSDMALQAKMRKIQGKHFQKIIYMPCDEILFPHLV